MHLAVRRADDVHRRWSLPDFDSYDLSSVRTGIMAGSPCPAELMKKLIASGIDEVTIAYG